MKLIDINGVEREYLSIAPDSEYPGYMKIEYESMRAPGGKRVEWYKTDVFVQNNPSLAKLAKDSVCERKDDLGVVTLATEMTLTDKSKKWKKNEFTGCPIWISRGKGEGQTRTVQSNSSNTVIIDTEWDMIPDKSSQYVLSANVHDPQVLGNSLPEVPVLRKKTKRAKLKN